MADDNGGLEYDVEQMMICDIQLQTCDVGLYARVRNIGDHQPDMLHPSSLLTTVIAYELRPERGSEACPSLLPGLLLRQPSATHALMQFEDRQANSKTKRVRLSSSGSSKAMNAGSIMDAKVARFLPPSSALIPYLPPTPFS